MARPIVCDEVPWLWGPWCFQVHDRYVRVVNRSCLDLRAYQPREYTVPSLQQFITRLWPGWRPRPAEAGWVHMALAVCGSDLDAGRGPAFQPVLAHTTEEITIRPRPSRRLWPRGDFVWWIFAVELITPGPLHLAVTPTRVCAVEPSTTLTTVSTVRLKNAAEVVHLYGTPLRAAPGAPPALVLEAGAPFGRRFVRVEQRDTAGRVSRVLRTRTSVALELCDRGLDDRAVAVELEVTDSARLAFDVDPLYGLPWTVDACIPILHRGRPVEIPGGGSLTMRVPFTHFGTEPQAFGLVLPFDLGDSDVACRPQAWSRGKPLQLEIFNGRCRRHHLSVGTVVAVLVLVRGLMRGALRARVRVATSSDPALVLRVGRGVYFDLSRAPRLVQLT